MNARENVSLTHLDRDCTVNFADTIWEGASCQEFIRELAINARSREQLGANLSCGTQQKVDL
jgi:ABC-type sugar transport system ATPase subunit